MLKDECYQEGRECNAIYQAHKAFHEVRRAIEAEAKIPADAKFADCKATDCGVFPKEYLQAAAEGHPIAAKAEKECFEEDGFCTLAARDLDELEATLNDALVSLDDSDDE